MVINEEGGGGGGGGGGDGLLCPPRKGQVEHDLVEQPPSSCLPGTDTYQGSKRKHALTLPAERRMGYESWTTERTASSSQRVPYTSVMYVHGALAGLVSVCGCQRWRRLLVGALALLFLRPLNKLCFELSRRRAGLTSCLRFASLLLQGVGRPLADVTFQCHLRRR